MGKIKGAIRTEGLHAGSLAKSIAVTTDDPAHPSATLIIKVNIVGSVNLFPASLFLAFGDARGPVGRLLVRKDETEKGDLKVSDVAAGAPWLAVTARRVEAATPAVPPLPAAQPGDWEIEATANPAGLPTGAYQAQLRFKTGLPREPEISVPVSFRIPPEVNVSTPQLLLPPPPTAGEAAKGMMYAMVRSDLNPADLRAEAEPASFHVALEPSGPRGYKVAVTWTPEGADPPREGRVTIRLGKYATVVAVRVATPAAPAPPVPAGGSQPPPVSAPGGR